MDRVEQKFDMIHVTPPQSAPDFIKDSPLAVPLDPSVPLVDEQGNPCIPSSLPRSANYFGWIDVDKHTLQHLRYPNIFSLGDVANLPTAKTGAAIRKQMPVVVENLFSYMNGKPLTGNYNGYSSCPLITGYGKIVMAEFDHTLSPAGDLPLRPVQGKVLHVAAQEIRASFPVLDPDFERANVTCDLWLVTCDSYFLITSHK